MVLSSPSAPWHRVAESSRWWQKQLREYPPPPGPEDQYSAAEEILSDVDHLGLHRESPSSNLPTCHRCGGVTRGLGMGKNHSQLFCPDGVHCTAVNIPYPQPAQLWNDGTIDEAAAETYLKKLFAQPSSSDSSFGPIIASASTSSLDSTFKPEVLPDSNLEMHFAWYADLVFIDGEGKRHWNEEREKNIWYQWEEGWYGRWGRKIPEGWSQGSKEKIIGKGKGKKK